MTRIINIRSIKMQSTNAPQNDKDSFISKMIFRILLLSSGLTLVTIGLLNGGFRDVMTKAIRICLECIGIG